ncbi:thiol-disulfide oxidoreductase DCC family protein [Candidatus Methylacidithermus pantelleriae]|nr:DCC1-like thiol-disulfide oxidoreductase family protein [Candidatus Methylacidithermus pantelleriae]
MPRLLVFYDGTCGLCHRWVQWVLQRDRSGIVRFATLQGRCFEKLARDYPWLKEMDSLVVVDLTRPDRPPLVRAQAVARVLEEFPGWRIVARCIRSSPQWVWNWLYEKTAQRRYSLFSNQGWCRALTPQEKKRFVEESTSGDPCAGLLSPGGRVRERQT